MKKIFAILFGVILLGGFLMPAVVTAETEPAKDPLCWLEEMCVDFDGDGVLNGEFDNTSPKAKNECGGAEYGYCYPVPEDYELSVSLPITGNITRTVSDLGDYINKIYVFLLGISTIIVIVTLMVGGFQYVTSPGGGEGVSKAKEKIKNSLIGLVILICSALLLATVNPQLLQLQIAKFPKIKTEVVIGNNMICETLVDKGFVVQAITESGPSCGYKTKILTNPSGFNYPEEDQVECIWTGCEGQDVSYTVGSVAFRVDATCLPEFYSNASPPHGLCVTCGNLSPEFYSSPHVERSTSFCATLNPEFHNSSGSSSWVAPDTWHAECLFDSSLGLNGGCVVVDYQCDGGSVTQCSDYGRVQFWSGTNTSFLTAASGVEIKNKFKEICQGDPCSVPGDCVYDSENNVCNTSP